MTSPSIARLQEQLRRAFEGEAWHGPSVLEAVQGVTPEQASAHPIVGAHSILELVLHLGSDYRLVLRRLSGDGHAVTPEEDWPPPSSSPEAWAEAIATLKKLHAELMGAVSAFPEERLDQPLVPEPPYTAFTQFIGITQHGLYHAGQIALLKRALGSR
jgi:uncharacterized damage-inducible protein DinB